MESVTVFCLTRIGVNGRSLGEVCFPLEKVSRKYEKAATRAVEKASYIPASVKGAPVEVYMHVSVLFDRREDGTCNVYAVPNWGVNADAYGRSYTAPQGIKGGSLPLSFYRDFRRRHKGHVGIGYVLAFDVSEQGVPGNVEVMARNVATDEELGKAISALEEARFIPGFADGDPVPMRHNSVLYIKPPRRNWWER